MMALRPWLVALAFVPYVYYGALDNLWHFGKRRVPWGEHLIHLFIGGSVSWLFVLGVRGMPWGQALAALAVSGGIDEFFFHRGLPEEETALHAKGHWSLVVFLAALIALEAWAGVGR